MFRQVAFFISAFGISEKISYFHPVNRLMKYILFSFSLLLLLSCSEEQRTLSGTLKLANSAQSAYAIDSTGQTIAQRFPAPEGFTRITNPENSFANYLQTFPLKEIAYPVHFYNGEIKENYSIYCSVIDQEIDKVDLQQCADAVMRLRGEYLYANKLYEQIHFNFLSDGKPRYYKEYVKGDYSYAKFRKYMRYIFSYANTGSLHDEMKSVEEISGILPGDVFIQKRTPYGHAVIVMDVVQNTEGKKLFLLAQSYMPAQETQILINPANSSPWFEAKSGTIETPEWNFQSSDLKRFKD